MHASEEEFERSTQGFLDLGIKWVEPFQIKEESLPEFFTSSSSSYFLLHLVHVYYDNEKLFFCDQDQCFLQTKNESTLNLVCTSALSFEPFLDCNRRMGTDTDEALPHSRHCKDMSWGGTTQSLPGKETVFNRMKELGYRPGFLTPRYLERIRDVYWEQSTLTTELIKVHKQTKKKTHNKKVRQKCTYLEALVHGQLLDSILPYESHLGIYNNSCLPQSDGRFGIQLVDGRKWMDRGNMTPTMTMAHGLSNPRVQGFMKMKKNGGWFPEQKNGGYSSQLQGAFKFRDVSLIDEEEWGIQA
ncbi:hypothetical protein L1987_44805 [Smallanthus sonchifolius]|uniref:Uncharacterized protein n=1 Tax=Smallanthus sonchifolius TaxID=185202 RepID=A0ACB9GRM6_9ASTR|nr:hypothetical protein L1987_44805 [Smallanthus sonchifolius]